VFPNKGGFPFPQNRWFFLTMYILIDCGTNLYLYAETGISESSFVACLVASELWSLDFALFGV
jgi:hypothetical protein